MIDDIVKNKIFGKIVSYFAVVKFQKRGLPHTHQSYTLADEDKPRTTEQINKIVTAEVLLTTDAEKKRSKKVKTSTIVKRRGKGRGRKLL